MEHCSNATCLTAGLGSMTRSGIPLKPAIAPDVFSSASKSDCWLGPATKPPLEHRVFRRAASFTLADLLGETVVLQLAERPL